MAMTIGVNKRPQGFDFASLMPGIGPAFQRLQGTGQVDQGMAQTIGGMRTGIDALASGMPLYDSASFNSAEAGRPSSQPIGLWYGYAGNDQEDNAAQNVWNLTNNANLDRNAYLYGRPDASRVEDGLSRTDYFDAKGKHKYTDVLNDPGTVGAFTPGDFGLIASGLGAMAGVYGIGNMLSAGIANAAGGAAGAGAAGAEAGGGSLLGGTLEPIGGSAFEVGLGNTTAGIGAGGTGFTGATGALAPGMTGGLGTLPYGVSLGTEAGLESLLGGLGGAPGLASGVGTGVGNAVAEGAGGAAVEGGAANAGGGVLGKTAFALPGIGDVTWGNLLTLGSVLGGGLAGSKGQQQSQTQTRELPPYLQGPVAGPNGLLASADQLMQYQLRGTPMPRGLLK